jgi:FG-GAP-like repeat
LRKQSFLRTTVVLIIVILVLGMVSQTVSALTNKNVRTWYWTSNTVINSVVTGDVDGDGKNETVTGGYYNDGTRNVAQLCVWDGATLALKNVKTWYWTSNTVINSVAVGNVDGDGKVEIVTGGYYYDGTQYWGQLGVWDGATLEFKNIRTWHWTNLLWHVYVYSVAIGDVDGDGKTEIVTGGYYTTGYTAATAELYVWDGATLAFENGKTWYWTSNTLIYSVAVGDVDGDGKTEIVTGGYYNDGTRRVAQLCVWDGATLSLKNVKTWYWTSNTAIESVVIGDVDGDGKVEIVTGGYYNDGTRDVAQLCVWDGATVALESVKTWYWTSNTGIGSVAVGDVDADGKTEILTGGYYNDGTRNVAQLCVWT